MHVFIYLYFFSALQNVFVTGTPSVTVARARWKARFGVLIEKSSVGNTGIGTSTMCNRRFLTCVDLLWCLYLILKNKFGLFILYFIVVYSS